MQNKKAWIRLVEAFIAIILIASVLALVINQRNTGEQEIPTEIYNKEILILRKIQLNNSLRQEVLDSSPPVSSLEQGFPSNVKDKITEEIPGNLDCVAKICEINEACNFEEISEEIGGDIYVQSVAIFANLETYAPKQLKLFCWSK